MDEPAAAAGEPVGSRGRRTRCRRHAKKPCPAFEQTGASAPQEYYDIFFSMRDEGVPIDVASDFVKAVIVADKGIRMRARQAHAVHAFQRDEAKARAGILLDEGENRMMYGSLREGLVKIQAKLEERARQPQASTWTSASVSYASNRPAATDPQLTKVNGVWGALPWCPSTDPVPQNVKDAWGVLPPCPSADPQLTKVNGVLGAFPWCPSTDPVPSYMKDVWRGVPHCPSTDRH